MKKFTFVAAMLCFGLALFAQKSKNTPVKSNLKVEWGPEFRDKTGSQTQELVGPIEEHYFALKTKTGANLGVVKVAHSPKYFVDKFDEDMKLVASSEELIMQYQGKELDIEKVVYFNNSLFFMGSFKNKEKKMKYLFYQKFDTKKLKLTGDLVKLSEIDFEEGSNRNSGEFDVKVSQDSTKLLVFFDVPGIKEKREQFGFHVFDKGFGLMWETLAEVPFEEGLFTKLVYEVDNLGNIYVIGKYYKDKLVEKRGGEVNYTVQMLRFTKDDEGEPQITELSLPAGTITNLRMIAGNDKNLFIGYYGEDASAGASGCFVMTTNRKSGEILTQEVKAFDKEFILLNRTEKEIKKADKKDKKGDAIGIDNLLLNDILVHKDGSMTIVGEVYYKQIVQYTNAQGVPTGSRTYYVYGEIVVFGLSKDLEIMWYQKIPKSQITVEDNGLYSSYFLLQMEDKMIFVYNDDEKNMQMVKAGKPEVFEAKEGSSVAVGVSMDYEGNVGKNKIFNSKSEGIFIMPKGCNRNQNGDILICAGKKKEMRYGIIKNIE